MDAREKRFWEKYYKNLIGHTITEAGVGKDGFPYFKTKKGSLEFTCEVSQDPEGNGPGFLFGLPTPPPPSEME